MDLFNEVHLPVDLSMLDWTLSNLEGRATLKSECRKECELIGLYKFSYC